MLRTALKIAVLAAAASLLAGFAPPPGLYHDLYDFRGEPLRAAIARLGPPIRRSFINGHRLYYWRVGYGDGVCKVWGIVGRLGVVTNWGYQDCAVW